MKHPESNKLFYLLVDHLPVAVILANTPKPDIIYKNKTVREFCRSPLKRTVEEADQHFYKPVLQKSKYIDNEMQLAKALLNDEISNGEKLIAEMKDGTLKWVIIYVFPLIKGNKKIGVIVFFSDITGLIQQQKEHNRNHNKLLKAVAHDLKSPFNGLILFSDFLLESVQSKNDNGTKEYAGLIKEGVQHALSTTNKLLEWVLSNTGSVDPEYKAIHLHHFIHSIINELAGIAKIKHLKIRSSISQNLYGRFDQNMIGCAVRNLLSNAIKFSNQGKSIEITVKRANESLIFSVRDYGIGMNKKQLAQFNFSGKINRLSGTEREFGNGIGLLITRNFVDMHHGKLWAESIPGEGSNFIFTIPDNQKV